MRGYASAFLLALLAIGNSATMLFAAEREFAELDSKRIAEIAPLLPVEPAGFGFPYSDRDYWALLEKQNPLATVVKQAEKLLKAEFPAWDDSAYLDFSRTGNRQAGEAMLHKRSSWLAPLVTAECVENAGRFTGRINIVLKEYVREPTWTYPAHDQDLKCFHRTQYSVDLRSSAFANELAQAVYLLGDKIDATTRRDVIAAIRDRVLAPVQASVRSGKGNWWLRAEHNWNAVCSAGVTGAALTIVPDRTERAEFVAIAEHYSRYYLNGFADDGYCTEGIAYWNYGFGNYVLLRDELMHATNSRLSLFRCHDPQVVKVRNVAAFGSNIEMFPGNAAAFGDCHLGAMPDAALLMRCRQTLGVGGESSRKDKGSSVVRGNRDSLVELCRGDSPSEQVSHHDDLGKSPDLHSYFVQSGVLVCRPAADAASRLAVTIKSGGNANHSHDDVGSFVIALGAEQLVGDPGGPDHYERDTFNNRRRTFKVINSFGHPVPLIDGQMQIDARKAKPRVLRTQFTPERDEITVDIASAYSVPGLKRLERTLRYDRTEGGAVTLEDAFEFAAPSDFEMALPTHGQFRQMGVDRLEFKVGNERLVATIDAPAPIAIASEPIPDTAPAAVRVAIRMQAPLRKGTLRFVFRPGSEVEKK